MNTPDPFIKCPYNPSHLILKSRMQYHLAKCRRNNSTIDTEICPFDATHHIPKPEFQYHVTVCPNRKVIDDHKYVMETKTRNLAPYVAPVLPPSDENWDADTVTSSYDPAQQIANEPIIRTVIGGTRSERKQFRQQERVRFGQLLEQRPASEKKDVPRELPVSEPLRLPKYQSKALQLKLKTEGNPPIDAGPSGDADSRNLLNAFSNLSVGLGRGGSHPKSEWGK